MACFSYVNDCLMAMQINCNESLLVVVFIRRMLILVYSSIGIDDLNLGVYQ